MEKLFGACVFVVYEVTWIGNRREAASPAKETVHEFDNKKVSKRKCIASVFVWNRKIRQARCFNPDLVKMEYSEEEG